MQNVPRRWTARDVARVVALINEVAQLPTITELLACEDYDAADIAPDEAIDHWILWARALVQRNIR